jgi:predicted metal-dependent enzyme (double-stranded beta helix superfamily)
MKRTSLMRRTSTLILSASLLGFVDAAREVSAQNVMTVAALAGVPIAQEPHHHLVFQNSFVNVYEIEVAPGDATLMHQHYYDNLFVVFGESELTNTLAGERPTKLDLSDLGIHFAREPYAHIIANKGKLPFRNITVELLQTQGELKNFYSSINDALDTAPPDGGGIRQARVLETDEVQVVAVAVPSSTAWSPPHDGHDRLVVMLDKINDGSGPTEKNSPFPAGMLAWFPADTDLSVPNESDQQMKLMILEFKDTPTKVD